MIVTIEGVQVLFPYQYIYPEQFTYMHQLKKTLDLGGHGMLEMSCGSGKTMCILSITILYILRFPEKVEKLIYCTRTVSEVEHVADELKILIKYYKLYKLRNDGHFVKHSLNIDSFKLPEEYINKFINCDIFGMALSCRKNMCIYKRASMLPTRSDVDNMCFSLTQESDEKMDGNCDDCVESEKCRYFSKLKEAMDQLNCDIGIDSMESMIELKKAENILPSRGVFKLTDWKKLGAKKGVCPYYMARYSLDRAHILIFSYTYLLSPKVASLVTKNLTNQSIVIFDEAHNIDNVCIESMSVGLSKNVLNEAKGTIKFLSQRVDNIKQAHRELFSQEYDKIVRNAHDNGIKSQNLQSPLPSNVLDNSIPGNVRKTSHFLQLLRRIVEFLMSKLKKYQNSTQSLNCLILQMSKECFIQVDQLKCLSERLRILMDTLKIVKFTDLSKIGPLSTLCDFGTILGQYADSKKFCIVWSRDHSRSTDEGKTYLDYRLKSFDSFVRISCLDASVVMNSVTQEYRSVVLTSGTLNPPNMYNKLLQFNPVFSCSISTVLPRQSILPIIVSKGNDQVELSTRFESRDDPSIIRNYGDLLISLCRVTPDGIVCFFPSYQYLETVLLEWYSHDLIDQIQKYKLIFIETDQVAETTLIVENFKKACDLGKGAILLSVARGKISEGVDFKHHYGRVVVVIGMPYCHTQNPVFKARLQYICENGGVGERDYLAFDAIRHAAQCVGRAFRCKSDYGVMIFADHRYNQPNNISRLPTWISNELTAGHKSMTTESAVYEVKRFLSEMNHTFQLKSSNGHAVIDHILIQKDSIKNEIVEKTLVNTGLV